MRAVVKTGGKQYRIAVGDKVTVERLEAEVGGSVELSEVLSLESGETFTLGQPLVAGAKVKAEVLEQGRADKIIVFKKKRRQNYRRKAGHRQDQTTLRITEIVAAA